MQVSARRPGRREQGWPAPTPQRRRLRPCYALRAMELDHVVILVNDLDAATRQWSGDGFTVTPGGVHADGLTHNALICFADGSYIELLAFRTAAPTTHRWERLRPFPGPIDYAVAVSDLPTFAQQAMERGLRYSPVTEGGRQRPDGVTIRWRLSWPPPDAEGLPFLIEDLTPRELRVPAGDNRRHANGAQGIAELTLAANDLSRTVRDLTTLFGAAADESGAFVMGKMLLRVRRPAQGYEAALIARRGCGPVSLAIALARGETRHFC